MLPIFIGFDHRQPISYNVLQHSILSRASKPVSITPLCLNTLSITRTGLTPFTFSRYLVPWLMGYQGWALFMDSDVLVLGDVAELFDCTPRFPQKDGEPRVGWSGYAAMVSKNVKQFEWASVMLWNCGHPANKTLTPEWIEDEANNPAKFGWLEGGAKSDLIGDFPREWNHLVGYDPPRTDAKLVHYTMGIPPYPETNMCEYAKEWHDEHQAMNSAVPWVQLMGNSVHACHLPDGRILPWFHPEVRQAQDERDQGAASLVQSFAKTGSAAE